MSDSVKIQGELSLGPVGEVSEGTFPASVASVPLSLLPESKPAAVSQRGTRKGEGAYETVFDATLDAVTEGNLVYVRVTAAGLIRITTDDGAGGNVVATLPIKGVHLHEYDPAKFVKKVEVNVSGTFEYIISGDR